MVADDDEDQEFTMSLRNKRAKKKLKRSIAVKSSKKSQQQSEKDVNDIQEEDPSKYKYACYHCQLSFIDRLERDRDGTYTSSSLSLAGESKSSSEYSSETKSAISVEVVDAGRRSV
jgi:hypothetical protein